jgi:hypothetical protein
MDASPETRTLSVIARAMATACLAVLTAVTARAGDFVVSNTSSAGAGSLAAAVAQANAAPGPHAITFSVGGTIAIASTLVLSREMTITGPGPLPSDLVLDGGNANRVFVVNAGEAAPVKVENLTIRNGRITSDNGGAILVQKDSTLTLATCVMTGNTTPFSGGALANRRGTANLTNCTLDGNSTGGGSGGAVYNSGTMAIAGSTFTNNSAPNDAGAVVNDSTATLTVTDSTFSGNAANANGGGGGAISNYGVATVLRSGFYDNIGVGYGGAIRADASGGGGTGSLTVVNSTFSGNTGGSANGAGGGAIGAVNAGTVRILNSTIVSNSAGSAAFGGGIYAGSGTTVEIRNSIVSANTVPPDRSGPDCVGTLQSQGYNIISDLKGCSVAGTLTGNLTGVDAQLAPLADNGGGTKTHALLAGSPARDAGDPAGCTDQSGSPLATDQRGITRPQGTACDIGAYEEALVLPSGNYQGLFWRFPAESESGWGMNFAHQGDTVFATWFTYDFDGKPTWFAAVLHLVAPGVYSGNIQTVTGPTFDATPWEASKVARTVVGTMTVAYSDRDNGVLHYTLLGVTQTKPITRQLFGAAPVCTWGTAVDPAQAANLQDLWWVGEAESGWGANFTHQGDVIVLTWFTYDADGKPLWLITVMNRQPSGAYQGPLKTVTGPAFNAVPFDPAKVVRTTVGSATLTPADGNHVKFDYTVGAVTQSKQITRQLFAPPAATVCNPG